MIRWLLLGIFSIGVLVLFPEHAFADNCSSPADCWGTAAGGAATAGGIGGGLLLWLWKGRTYPGHETHGHVIDPPGQWFKERLSPEDYEELWRIEDRLKKSFDEQREYEKKHSPDFLMKFYKLYQRAATRIGGEEKKFSIAASGKA